MACMKPVCLALVAGIITAGCTTQEMRKDGASAADRQADERDCTAVAGKSFPPGDPSMGNAAGIELERSMRMRTVVADCMRSIGWK